MNDRTEAAARALPVGAENWSLFPDGNAVLSECGKYRYWLERGPQNAPFVTWVLANPSTADANIDDPTVRKARGFTERWGFKRFVFVNVFAGRSTDPRGLLKMKDAVGPENERYIREAVNRAEFVVLAWGNAIVKHKRPQAAWTYKHVIHPLRTDSHIRCLGYTADGSPRHPLMLAYSTPLEQYAPTGARAAATPTTPAPPGAVTK